MRKLARFLYRLAAELWLVPPLLVVLAIACRRESANPYDPLVRGTIAFGPELSDAQAVMLASTWAILFLLLVSFLLSAVATMRSRRARVRYLLATAALAAVAAVVAGFWPERADYPNPANYRPPPLFLQELD